MKLSLYGFVTINSLIDNRLHQDSLLGELSAVSRTYALDKGYFTDDRYPNIRLVTFRCREDENNITPPNDIKDLCIKLGAWMELKARQGSFTLDTTQVKQAISAEFRGMIRDIKLGKMISVRDQFLPQFIEFSLANTNQYETSTLKLWFSDPAFKQQYPFYEIVVIPPVENIDSFFDVTESVRNIKKNINLPEIHDKANRLREQSPYTLIKSYDYQWNSQELPRETVDIPWTILIYGGIGENPDIIRDALANWVLENSTRSREDWEQIFPDLFVPSEYTIVPFWQSTSVPGYRLVDSMYSPIITHADVIPICKDAMSYTEAHIRQHVEIGASLYKSLSFAVVGDPRNRLTPVRLYEAYPQYALIGSRTEDFNRMDTNHQGLIHTLYKLFLTAEEATLDTELDLSMAKVWRDGRLYITTTYNNVQYLVLAKSNYTTGILKRQGGETA